MLRLTVDCKHLNHLSKLHYLVNGFLFIGSLSVFIPKQNQITKIKSVSFSLLNRSLIHIFLIFQAIYEQVFGKPFSDESPYPAPTMNGFVQNAEAITPGMSEKVVMQGFPPERLPVFKELVQEFAVCDRWFSSLPSSTQPNRLYVHSATSNGAFSNDTNTLVRGFPQKTVFESLEESKFTFGIYYQSFPNCLFYR